MVPVLWTLGTLYAGWFHYETIYNLYQSYPVLTVETVLIWIIFGSAFLPVSRKTYTWGSVALITGGTVFGLMLNGFDFGNQLSLVIAGGILIGVCVAWLGGFGTLYWRFAQGKVAVDDDDTHDHH